MQRTVADCHINWYAALPDIALSCSFYPLHRRMGSHTFSTPSSLDDDSVTLLDIWEHHENHSSDHPLFLFNSGEANGGVITWGEAIRAMHAAGRVILDALIKDGLFVPSSEHRERPVVGILAVSG